MRDRLKFLCVAAFVAFGGITPADAAVRLPAIISDHMVVQAGMPVKLWGWADPQEEVSATIAGQTKTTKANAQGKWLITLDPPGVRGPQQLHIRGSNELTINDLLVGELWLCSGQSNMAFTVSGSENAEQEQAASIFPEIRLFRVALQRNASPQDDCKGEWIVCSPETVGRFSATAFYFGRELHRTLKQPVGLIVSAVGGTPIESWIDADAQRRMPELQGYFSLREANLVTVDEAAQARYQKQLAAWQKANDLAKAEKKQRPRKPEDPKDFAARKNDMGGLYNGMIAPLIPYTIRGAIWYQGEANSYGGKAEYYQFQLPLLVESWRQAWGEGSFPVAWVQLPNFKRSGEGWMLVREAMLKSLRVPNTGMAVAIDVGDPDNIHPAKKQPVGHRLAAWALATVYGKDIASSGPLPKTHDVRGSDIVVTFSHADGGLVARDGELRGFQIAGDDRQWHAAKAKIDGNGVIVTSANVSKPLAVRYAWADNPECNLYNSADLPASPFRTDDWVTEE